MMIVKGSAQPLHSYTIRGADDANKIERKTLFECMFTKKEGYMSTCLIVLKIYVHRQKHKKVQKSCWSPFQKKIKCLKIRVSCPLYTVHSFTIHCMKSSSDDENPQPTGCIFRCVFFVFFGYGFFLFFHAVGFLYPAVFDGPG